MAGPYKEVWQTRQVHLTILWTLQLSCASVTALAAILLLIPYASYPGFYFFGGLYGNNIFKGLVFLIVFLVVVGLNGHEVWSYREGALSPTLVFYSGCFKTLVGLAWFVFTVVGAALGDALLTLPSIIFSLGLLITGGTLADMGRKYRNVERRGVHSLACGEASGAAAVRDAADAVEMGYAGTQTEAESERTIVR